MNYRLSFVIHNPFFFKKYFKKNFFYRKYSLPLRRQIQK